MSPTGCIVWASMSFCFGLAVCFGAPSWIVTFLRMKFGRHEHAHDSRAVNAFQMPYSPTKRRDRYFSYLLRSQYLLAQTWDCSIGALFVVRGELDGVAIASAFVFSWASGKCVRVLDAFSHDQFVFC